MYYVRNVKPLPDLFGLRWGQVNGVALPGDLVELLVRLAEEAKEAREREEGQEKDRKRKEENVLATVAVPVLTGAVNASWTEPTNSHALCVKIFDRDMTERAAGLALQGTRDSDAKEAIQRHLKMLRERGEKRALLTLPRRWRQVLAELEKRFPNFGNFIEHLRHTFAAASLEDGVLRLDPVLLQGPPGVGKSFFCQELARALGSQVTRINMESVQENGCIVGSSEFWSNSRPGRVFEALVAGQHANSVMIVEEIEKSSADRYDPLTALLTLLEPMTASTFADQSVPWVSMDASRLIWICTANNAVSLPTPIQSRLRRFDIPEPTIDQGAKIIESIFTGLRAEFPKAARRIRMSEGARIELAKLSPRRARIEMKTALGRAIYMKRKLILADDVKTQNQRTTRRPIGFY